MLPLTAKVADAQLSVRFVVVSHDIAFAPVPVNENVPDPQLIVRVPVPLLFQPFVENVGLLLFVANCITQPEVEAVHAPVLSEDMLKLVFTVIVHVVPPTQVAASNVTSSPTPGTDAPVAPPDVVDHIAVLEPSQVHVVVHTAKRVACAAVTHSSAKRRNAMRRTRPFIVRGPCSRWHCIRRSRRLSR